MELVEGADAGRPDRCAAPIPLDEALPIARQIVEALDYAHEKGVLHRDLKPANIKVTPEGEVKVLDFGLAKAMSPTRRAPGSGGVAPHDSPTITSPAFTQAGTILGTAAYMAPEQVRGRAVDKRADIWAFGCVLYEMLTGTRAFAGDTVSDTLAAVLKNDPDWTKLPASAPGARASDCSRRCLERAPRARLRDIADATAAAGDNARPGGRGFDGSGARAAHGSPPSARRRGRPPPSLGRRHGIRYGRTTRDCRQDLFAASPCNCPWPLPTSTSGGGSALAVAPDGGAIAFIGRRAAGQPTSCMCIGFPSRCHDQHTRRNPNPGTLADLLALTANGWSSCEAQWRRDHLASRGGRGRGGQLLCAAPGQEYGGVRVRFIERRRTCVASNSPAGLFEAGAAGAVVCELALRRRWRSGEATIPVAAGPARRPWDRCSRSRRISDDADSASVVVIPAGSDGASA